MVTFPPLPQPKPVLNLATPEGCKAELTLRAILLQNFFLIHKASSMLGQRNIMLAVKNLDLQSPQNLRLLIRGLQGVIQLLLLIVQ